MKKSSSLLVYLFLLLISVDILPQPIPKIVNKKFPTILDGFRIENGDTLIGFFMSSDIQTTSSVKNAGGEIYSTINNITTGTIPLNNLSTVSNNIQWMTPAGAVFIIIS
jgi:hypothetical protein